MSSSKSQLIVITVSVPEGTTPSAVKASFSRQGSSRSIDLSDDGSHLYDTPGDGTWTGSDAGGYVREINLQLMVSDPSAGEQLVYSGVVYTPDEALAALSFQVARHGSWTVAHQVAATGPGSPPARQEAQNLHAGAAWMMTLTVLIASALRVMRRERQGW